MRLCKFTFTIISSLPCLHTFWHAIPTSFYIFNVFKSCIYAQPNFCISNLADGALNFLGGDLLNMWIVMNMYRITMTC